MIKEKQKKYLLDESTLKTFAAFLSYDQHMQVIGFWYRYNFSEIQAIEESPYQKIIHHFDFFLFNETGNEVDNYVSNGDYPRLPSFAGNNIEVVIDNDYLLYYDEIMTRLKENDPKGNFGHVHKIYLQKDGAITINGENYLPVWGKQKGAKYYVKSLEDGVYNNICLSGIRDGLNYRMTVTGHLTKKSEGEKEFGIWGVYPPNNAIPFQLVINFNEGWWAVNLDGTRCFWHEGLEVEDFYKVFTVDFQLSIDTQSEPGYVNIIPRLRINGHELNNQIKQLSEDNPEYLQFDVSKGTDLLEAWIHEFNENIYLFDLGHERDLQDNSGYQVNMLQIFYMDWGDDLASTLQNPEQRILLYAKNSKTLTDGVEDYILEDFSLV